jgi:hypothetical protein
VLTIKDLKKFHEMYKRLSLLDHVILLVVSEEIVGINDIYMRVFERYRQSTKGELRILIRKLAKLDLIRFEYYLSKYIITKSGIEELEFVEEYLKTEQEKEK